MPSSIDFMAASMPALGVTKFGSPTPSDMQSGIEAAKSKYFLMPDGFIERTALLKNFS